MKCYGLSEVFFLFLIAAALAGTARAETKTVRSAREFRDADESWTCVIDRPQFWYVGWARDEATARDQAVQACMDDGDASCTAAEAICNEDDGE